MTSGAHIIHADGNKKLVVRKQVKNEAGEWVDAPTNYDLPLVCPGQYTKITIWDTQRYIIEEFGDFIK